MDKGYLKIAKIIMLSILYDNGYINKCHTEKSQLSEKWQKRIAPIAVAIVYNALQLTEVDDYEAQNFKLK